MQCTDLLLKAGADVNIQDKYGNTALVFAVSKRCVLCTDQLLKSGADVNITDNDGKTALFYAASADVSIKDKQGKRALFYAASGGSLKCIDLLLKAGADVNIQSQWDGTALFHAVSVGSVQCTDMLLKAGADVNARDQSGRTVLFLLNDNDYSRRRITLDKLNAVRLTLRKGIKVNVRDNESLNALTFHLKNTFKLDDPHCSTFAMLLLSAGETVDTDGRIKLLKQFNQNDDMVPVEASEYLRSSAEISLMNICRETIRKHLLQMNDVNLFIRVPRLPLPKLIMSNLLYDVTLDQEEEDDEDNDDSDGV